MRENFIGVIWPRVKRVDKTPDKPYTYIVVGMLLTDNSLEHNDENQLILPGSSVFGMSEALNWAGKSLSNEPLGSADDVLLNLRDLLKFKNKVAMPEF